ncbi:MAG: CvpA family protein [Fuerstiella sp.]|nr:CvpA family protein [Fuerstiella sp.]
MVWYDFVILAILAYGVWQGASRGFVMQLAWIVAIVLCFKFADKLAPQIEPLISVESPRLRHWIAMFILYLGFSLGTFLVARSLSGALEKAKFQDFDRQLGGLFGLLKGAILSLVITFFAVTLSDSFSVSLRNTVARSQTGHVACLILDEIAPLIPEDANPVIKQSLAEYKKTHTAVHNEDGGTEASPEDFIDHRIGVARSSGGATGQNYDDLGFSDERFGNGFEFRESYDTLLDLLPESMKNRTSLASLRDRWNHMTAKERDRLLTDLKYQSSTEKIRLLNRLFAPVRGQGGGAEPATEAGLLARIADEYQDFEDPDLMIIRIKQHLDGLPQRIRAAVLEDWYIDLTGSGRDPDPRTDVDTRIDDRILNQLDQSRESIDRLTNFDLRTRLKRSR